MKRKLKTRQFKSNGGYTAGGYSGSKTSTQSRKMSDPNQQNTTISVDDRFTDDLVTENNKEETSGGASTPSNTGSVTVSNPNTNSSTGTGTDTGTGANTYYSGTQTFKDTLGTTEAPRVEYTLPDSLDAEKIKVDEITPVEAEFSRTQQLGERKTLASEEADSSMAYFQKGYAGTAFQQEEGTAASFDSVDSEDLKDTKAAMLSGAGRDSTGATEITVGQSSLEAAERDSDQEDAAKAGTSVFTKDAKSEVGQVTADKIILSSSKEAEEKTREVLTEDNMPKGTAAQIINAVGFDAAQRRTVTGQAAKGAAATMIAEVGNLPEEIAPALVEDPAKVTAQIDEQPVEVRAAIAALPQEALVSTQIEGLLAGIEDGETPVWARAAVASVNNKMAARGLNVSTIGRDALFNAIIQTAFPIAQANAQALQTRAAQNLSNQQQANMAQSELDMRRRMTNLANQQQSESQSAQMAQQLNVLQSQFKQDARMLSAQQTQQTEVQNLSNRQEASKVSALNKQAILAQELNNEQQVELAEMQYMNATEKENMSAIQQERLAEFQVAADFMSKNAAFKQQMEIANINEESKIKLANLQSKNLAASEQLSNSEKIELANLNARVQENITSAKIAESMGVAQLNVDQQRAVINAQTQAKIDLTKFNDAQQVEIANSKFMQSMTLTDFNARQQEAVQNATLLAQTNLAEADANTKIRVSNAQSFLKIDMANLSNEQQALMLDQQLEQQRLLSNQSASNASKQFNAANEQQLEMFMANLAQDVEKFNVAQRSSMSQFNAIEKNKVSALNSGREIDISKFNAQLLAQNAQFNAEASFKRDQWNAANKQAVEQANVEWRRQSNTINTAAQNAANQKNAQMQFSIDSMEQDFMWQMLRDDAKYVRDAYENSEGRKAALYSVALQNEAAAGKGSSNTSNLLSFIADIFGE